MAHPATCRPNRSTRPTPAAPASLSGWQFGPENVDECDFENVGFVYSSCSRCPILVPLAGLIAAVDALDVATLNSGIERLANVVGFVLTGMTRERKDDRMAWYWPVDRL